MNTASIDPDVAAWVMRGTTPSTPVIETGWSTRPAMRAPFRAIAASIARPPRWPATSFSATTSRLRLFCVMPYPTRRSATFSKLLPRMKTLPPAT